MKVFIILHYTFNGNVYPGIDYVDSVVKTMQEFEMFLIEAKLHAVTFPTCGEVVHRQLRHVQHFYNGLYKDLLTQRHYMICDMEVDV